MDFEVPQNVEINKSDKPKGWSYPLKTSEIVTALDLGGVGEKFAIYYSNHKPTHTFPHNQKKLRGLFEKNFNILHITWYGHFVRTVQECPYFHMSVHLCKPEYRQRLNKAIIEEIFPVILPWVKDVKRLPTINGISLDYREFNDPVGSHDYSWGLELYEGSILDNKRLFAMALNLEKKDVPKVPGLEA
jgi:hypothetical protein